MPAGGGHLEREPGLRLVDDVPQVRGIDALLHHGGGLGGGRFARGFEGEPVGGEHLGEVVRRDDLGAGDERGLRGVPAAHHHAGMPGADRTGHHRQHAPHGVEPAVEAQLGDVDGAPGGVPSGHGPGGHDSHRDGEVEPGPGLRHRGG